MSETKPADAATAAMRSIPVVVLSGLEQELLKKEQPLKASFGGNNAFYHYCEALQGRSNYAVCLHTLAAARRHDKNQQELRPTCYDHIRSGKCNAVKMRKAEVASQRSLFFIDRADVEEARRLEEAQRAENPTITFRRNGTSRQPLRGNWVDDSQFREQIAERATEPETDGLKSDLMQAGTIQAAINNTIGAEE